MTTPIDSTLPTIMSPTPTTQDANTLGKTDFLKLLMAQLSNQDPLSPVDGQAFVAQLAQFANVEQLQNANQSLTQLLSAQSSQTETSSAALVGKQAVYNTNNLSLTAGGTAVATAQLATSAANVSAVVSDANGKVIRTVQMGPQDAGPLTFAWDGKDDSGASAAAGQYTVSFSASDSAGNSLAVATQGQSIITGISISQGATQLLLQNGARISLSDVSEISQTT